MADDSTYTGPLNLTPDGLMPFDQDSNEQETRGLGPPDHFLYLGQPLTADEFTAYVQTYNFGTIPPDFIVLHHTATPGTVYTGAMDGSDKIWDARESGMNDAQIKAHRQQELDVLRDYYWKTLCWDCGPHLNIDDRYIWLFTPMREIGIHARWGNSFHDGNGQLHYSIGIEVLGYYEHKQWPPAVARLVGHAVAVLQRRLGTFDLRYLYADPASKPGMYTDKDGTEHCTHPERLRAGGISSHRDYNKLYCPGAAITESFYLDVITRAWHDLTAPPPAITTTPPPATPVAAGAASPAAPAHAATAARSPAAAPAHPAAPPVTPDSSILAPPSVDVAQVAAYLQAHLPQDSEYAHDAGTILAYYWQYAPGVGIDPLLAAAQCLHETVNLTSYWAGRPRRNPANLGVPDPNVHTDGLTFDSWESAVQAHLGHLLACTFRDHDASQAQRQMMAHDPLLGLMDDTDRGTGRTLAAVAAHWNPDPAYAVNWAQLANTIRGS